MCLVHKDARLDVFVAELLLIVGYIFVAFALLVLLSWLDSGSLVQIASALASVMMTPASAMSGRSNWNKSEANFST